MVDIEFLGIRVILLRQSLHARPCLAQDAHMGRNASVRDAGEEGGATLQSRWYLSHGTNLQSSTKYEFRVGLGVWLGRGAG